MSLRGVGVGKQKFSGASGAASSAHACLQPAAAAWCQFAALRATASPLLQSLLLQCS
jgi:hypothetical protein